MDTLESAEVTAEEVILVGEVKNEVVPARDVVAVEKEEEQEEEEVNPFEGLTVADMKEELERRGLPRTGSRQDLMDTLRLNTINGKALSDMKIDELKRELGMRNLAKNRITKQVMIERLQRDIYNEDPASFGVAAQKRLRKRWEKEMRGKKRWMCVRPNCQDCIDHGLAGTPFSVMKKPKSY